MLLSMRLFWYSFCRLSGRDCRILIHPSPDANRTQSDRQTHSVSGCVLLQLFCPCPLLPIPQQVCTVVNSLHLTIKLRQTPVFVLIAVDGIKASCNNALPELFHCCQSARKFHVVGRDENIKIPVVNFADFDFYHISVAMFNIAGLPIIHARVYPARAYPLPNGADNGRN